MPWEGARGGPRGPCQGRAAWGMLRAMAESTASPAEALEQLLEAYQKRLDEAQAAGAARYGAVFEDGPPGVGVHEIDTGMVLRRVSGAELALLGYSREQMLGRPVVDFIVMDQASKRAIAKKLTGTFELRPFVRTFRRADGTPITLMLLDRHLRDRSGTITGIRSVMKELATT
jgi:PAS domain S-box-containing protein